MPNETRINLRHLLEDIRDSYAAPLEEVIVTELIANALDSGASKIEFVVSADTRTLRCTDDGCGMRRAQLREYHNIAASTKTRGEGIGFAGIGAKLSLLVAEMVRTESKGVRGTRAASEWSLTSPLRAPWHYVPFSGSVTSPRGTSVAITLRDAESLLLDPQCIIRTIQKHFYALLDPWLMAEFLRFVYRKGVSFFVQGECVGLPDVLRQKHEHLFRVHLGKGRKPVGMGFLGHIGDASGTRVGAEHLFTPGLAVSTHGKIIKTGWEWLGVTPRFPENLFGVVEVPSLSELLTTNKSDFLHNATHLKRYYRFRKAIQEAVLPILRLLGEERPTAETEPSRLLRPLRRDVEAALSQLIGNFPELESLVAVRKHKTLGTESSKKSALRRTREEAPARGESAGSVATAEEGAHEKQPVSPQGTEGQDAQRVTEKKPGMRIAFEGLDAKSRPLLGRMVGETLTVNTNHPAWQKAQEEGAEEYHVMLTVAVVLSDFLDPTHNPQEFISTFLAAWGRPIRQAQGRQRGRTRPQQALPL